MNMLQAVVKCTRQSVFAGVRTLSNGVKKQKPNSLTLFARVKAFAEKEGRQPRILIAKMGQGGNDPETMQVATGFADFGFDVDLGPHVQTPDEVARHAVDADVHAVGVRNLVVNHATLVPTLVKELERLGRPDIPVIIACDVPFKDRDSLYKAGVAAILDAEVDILERASETLDRIEEALSPTKPEKAQVA